ncbi:flocculation protein FLO11-like [Ischnura elegans]|uniref:flocculation protein FLO11-like n=1 Tax=Ischnura elegans TaxID=197161 RepID=UPI001ED87FE3|nr:flocculation protein FLO11-like [Ischnura elegans]
MAKARAKRFKSPGTREDHVDPPPNLPRVTVHPPRQGEGADGLTSSGHVDRKTESPLTSPRFPFPPTRTPQQLSLFPYPGPKTSTHWLASGPSTEYKEGPGTRKDRDQGVEKKRKQPTSLGRKEGRTTSTRTRTRPMSNPGHSQSEASKDPYDGVSWMKTRGRKKKAVVTGVVNKPPAKPVNPVPAPPPQPSPAPDPPSAESDASYQSDTASDTELSPFPSPSQTPIPLHPTP